MNKYPVGIQGVDQHQDWLSLVSPEGPFLSIPILNQTYPNGVDRPDPKSPDLLSLMETHKLWRKNPIEHNDLWIRSVLELGAKWPKEQLLFDDQVPAEFEVFFAEQNTSLKPLAVLLDTQTDQVANAIFLVMKVSAEHDLRAVSEDGWTVSPILQLARLLRRTKASVGLVTNGRWWSLVWADSNSMTASAVFDSLVWNEEKLMRDAFFSLVGIQRQIGVAPEDRLPNLFTRSLLGQEEITDSLGKQVRKAVELLVQSFSESRILALAQGHSDPLPADEQEPYEAAVMIMMRIVFLLFAEERGLLPVDQELYGSSYGVSNLITELEEAERLDATALDRSTDVWHRVLATSTALYLGTTFEDMRMPAYGGSLFDPDRFTWLYSNRPELGLNIVVHDRVMLQVLRSIQVVNQNKQARRISFREIDVEEIGYVYEGLLGYASKKVESEAVLGLLGSDGDEPELSLEALIQLKNSTNSIEAFVEALLSLIEDEQPAAKPFSKTKILNAMKSDVDKAQAQQQLGAVTAHNADLVEKIIPFYNLLRRDLRGLPYVVPKNGIVVIETRSRKNAGAHYTPRALAEEVVLHALEPLVYSPGPLQSEDPSEWKIKSSAAILDLKIVDIAAGSGAFLVAAARYLAERLVEAWKHEGIHLDTDKDFDPDRTFDPIMTKAIREVVSRCLYGADINEMAVEMCKLSLWLISLDPARPFSFLDDKVMVGNSLLGLTSLDQIRKRHIYPELKVASLFDDVHEPIEKAIRLRNEIAASPVDDSDVHRSAAHKANLLNQANEATKQLREIADAVVATGLLHGGKPGKKLDDAYTELELVLDKAYSESQNRTKLEEILEAGLKPEVETDYLKWKPLHWIIEVPHIMQRGGFDAVIGNPPFLVSKKISGAVGSNMREWFANVVARMPGRGDLITYFVRRASQLTSTEGNFGLICAKAITEGDSLQVGIEPLSDEGWHVYKVDRNRPWPAREVGTNIAIIWGSRIPVQVPSVLDGSKVRAITRLLDSEDNNLNRPIELIREHLGYQGSIFLGDGFLMPKAEARVILSQYPMESEVLKPFLNAQDLNSSPYFMGPRYIIDFRELSQMDAKKFSASWAIVESRVKPERMKDDGVRYPRLINEWWQHLAPRPELYSKVNSVSAVVALAAVSKLMIPARVTSKQVLSSALVVFPLEDYAFFGLVSSWFHRSWSQWWGSKMRNDYRYSISDCFDTFPLPAPTKPLESLGEKLDSLQKKMAINRNVGLTKLYSLVNSTTCMDEDIIQLRKLHEQIDREVALAYKFDIELGEFEISDFKGQPQWGPPQSQRIEILQLLLAENNRQYSKGAIQWPVK